MLLKLPNGEKARVVKKSNLYNFNHSLCNACGLRYSRSVAKESNKKYT